MRVWNDARAIERCVDKSTTTFLLHKAGIPTPANAHHGDQAAGRRLRGRCRPAADLQAAVRIAGQRPAARRRSRDSCRRRKPPTASITCRISCPPSGSSFEDWRVIVTRSRVVAAMARRAGTWITNVHQGGEPSAHEPSEEMAQLASGALAAVGADYAGVDLIRTPDGRLLVLEVNSNPSWRGLQSVTDVDIARTHRRGLPDRRRRASAARAMNRFLKHVRLEREADERAVPRRLPRRAPGAEAGQRARPRRRPRHGGGAVRGERRRRRTLPGRDRREGRRPHPARRRSLLCGCGLQHQSRHPAVVRAAGRRGRGARFKAPARPPAHRAQQLRR